MAGDIIAEDVIGRFEVASTDRGNWETHWEDVAQRMLTSYAGSFIGNKTQGERRTREMVDPTAALALPKFAAAMESMLTPRAQTWHRLVHMDKMLMTRNRIVREWFDQANDVLFRYRYAPNANYASQQHEIYMGLGAFGTGCLFIDALTKRWGGGLRYRAIHLGEVYFLENHQGIIDTAFRKFELTARQALQWFPQGLPEMIVSAANEPKTSEKKFEFLHAVMPRDDAEYDANRADVHGMMFVSYYISLTGKQRVLAGGKETGYNTFPYAISRYVQAPGEVYGRSPAMLALPGIKTLNEQVRTMLKVGHRTADPIYLAHDDGVVDTFNATPGSIVPGGVSADGKLLVHAMPVGNLGPADKMMEMGRHQINDAFLVTLFQILVETPQMTATEVLERAREKGALLSPTMGRQQSEALGPMIHRELDVLAMQGRLPPMPQVLRDAGGLNYEVVYESPLSRSQRAEGGAGFLRLMTHLQEIVALTQDPAPLDNLNFDAAVPDLAEMNAIPTRWLNDPTAVAAIRQQRAQSQQQKALMDAAPSLAGVAKALPSINLRGVAGGA